MKKQTATIYHDFESLGEDAKNLVAATADVAEGKVVEARKRLTAALDRGREAWDSAREKAVDGAKATDEVIRGNPYQAIGCALGVGALLGFLLSRRG